MRGKVAKAIRRRVKQEFSDEELEQFKKDPGPLKSLFRKYKKIYYAWRATGH